MPNKPGSSSPQRVYVGGKWFTWNDNATWIDYKGKTQTGGWVDPDGNVTGPARQNVRLPENTPIGGASAVSIGPDVTQSDIKSLFDAGLISAEKYAKMAIQIQSEGGKAAADVKNTGDMKTNEILRNHGYHYNKATGMWEPPM